MNAFKLVLRAMEVLTEYVMDQKLTLNILIDHADALCCKHTAKTADCAPPIPFIHAASDTCVGYFFKVIA